MGHIPPLSFKVGATLAAYRGVVMNTGTANTVKYPGAATDLPIGITGDTVKDITDGIPVYGPGNIAKLEFADSCTSGKMVKLDTNGKGLVHADTTAGTYVIGTLIGPDVQTAGQIADVLIQPFYKAIP